MAPSRRRCEVCGSKQWRKEPSSGLITCKEGHVLQNYRNETREINDLGHHVLKKRTLRSVRKKKGRQSRADPKLYHGERARYHYFQCLQLILRMQIQALIRLWELPAEYEVICRDVWALHLKLLRNPPPAEPYLYRQEQQDGGESSTAKASSQDQELGAQPQNLVPQEDEDDEQEEDGDRSEDEDIRSSSSKASSSRSSSSPSEDEDEEKDPELAELLREASEAPSSPSEDEDDELYASQRPPEDWDAYKKRKRRHRKSNNGYDSPAGNLAVLVVACWTLRLPITYMDFVRVIKAYELPYLDPVRLLPAPLTRHLPKHTIQALSPHHAPSVLHVHRLTSRLAKLLYTSFRVYTPEMHGAPMLWRAVQCLHGTPTLYTLSKKLASVLQLPMTLHHSLTTRLKRHKQNDPGFHMYDDAPVEVTLVAVVIIVLKLVYRLGEESRPGPYSDNDPLHALPDLAYCIELIEADKKKASNSMEALLATDSTMSALDLDDHLMDEYLEFCQAALLPREDRLNDRDVATEFFPLQSLPDRPPDASTSTTSSGFDELPKLSAMCLPQDDDAPLPGQEYKIYSSADLLGSLPLEYELILDQAAKWCGVDESYVSRAVERFERRLCKWWNRLQKQTGS
ncbi:unnamed protein product [Somion occarium]|uniref:RRN7-type domain-containing protein n=1 Tax=Somion occarium TaxID=3059160 RepID=A0ABP1CYL6_9APHY